MVCAWYADENNNPEERSKWTETKVSTGSPQELEGHCSVHTCECDLSTERGVQGQSKYF